MIARASQDHETAVAPPAPPAAEFFTPQRIQRVWTVLLAAVVLAGPWFLPSGSTRAPLTKTGPMSTTDSIFRENGAGEDMTAKTRAAISATRGIRPILAVAPAGDPEGSYLANLVQSVAWPRQISVRYLGSDLPPDWSTEFDAIVLCHWGTPPAGARIIERDVVVIDASEAAP